MSSLHILLKPWEVRGILDGTLTQLVRPVRMPEDIDECQSLDFSKPPEQCKDAKYLYVWKSPHYEMMDEYIECPFGKPGDILWVKETFYQWDYQPPAYAESKDSLERLVEEGKPNGPEMPPLYPAETMSQEYSRLSIMNVETKVERVWDFANSSMPDFITEIDAAGNKRFSLTPTKSGWILPEGWGRQWNLDYPDTPLESNPWVWVATIRKVET